MRWAVVAALVGCGGTTPTSQALPAAGSPASHADAGPPDAGRPDATFYPPMVYDFERPDAGVPIPVETYSPMPPAKREPQPAGGWWCWVGSSDANCQRSPEDCRTSQRGLGYECTWQRVVACVSYR